MSDEKMKFTLALGFLASIVSVWLIIDDEPHPEINRLLYSLVAPDNGKETVEYDVDEVVVIEYKVSGE